MNSELYEKNKAHLSDLINYFDDTWMGRLY